MLRRMLMVLPVVMALALGGCASVPYARDGRLPTPVQPADGSADRTALNARVYDAATGHARRLFYRDDFNGVDFDAETAALRERALAQTDEAGLYAVLGDLLQRLDDDHTYASSPTQRAREAARRAGEADAGYGLLLTAIGREYYVATVVPGTPAADAGVQPGWRAVSIGGRPVRTSAPPVLGRSARLVFADDAGDEHAVDLVARSVPALPRREFRRMDGDIAYLRFDDFDRPTRDWLEARMAELAATPPQALILDLRRNGGGSLDIAALVNAHFQPGRDAFARIHGRLIDRQMVAGPEAHPWLGPMRVLIGPTTVSAAELLAARLQTTGRATLVGQRTRGGVIGTRPIDLPDGGELRIGMAVMSTPDGQQLEKVGVTPDIAVPPDWAAVRAGRDPELDAALASLRPIPETGAADRPATDAPGPP